MTTAVEINLNYIVTTIGVHGDMLGTLVNDPNTHGNGVVLADGRLSAIMSSGLIKVGSVLGRAKV